MSFRHVLSYELNYYSPLDSEIKNACVLTEEMKAAVHDTRKYQLYKR